MIMHNAVTGTKGIQELIIIATIAEHISATEINKIPRSLLC